MVELGIVRGGHTENVNFDPTLERDQGVSHANMGAEMGEHFKQRERVKKKPTVQHSKLGVSLVFRRSGKGSSWREW